MEGRLTLSDVLSRSVPIEWFEAVAVVRGVCALLLAGAQTSSGTPDLHQIVIAEDGTIDVTGRVARHDDAVRRMGQLLQALLTQSELPVPLRLVMSQATAAPPLYGDLKQFDEALAYFERPGRTGVLQALFGKATAAAMPGGGSPADAPGLDDVAPLPAEVARPEPPSPAARRRRTRAVAVAALAVLAILGTMAGVRVARAKGVTIRMERISAATLKATDAIGKAVVSGVSAVSDRAGLGRLSGPEASAPRPAPASTGDMRGSEAHPRAAAKRPSVLRAFDLEPYAVVPVANVVVIAEPLRSAEPASSALRSTSPPDDSVYASGSPGVVPPIAVRPQLPRVLPEGLSRPELSRIEVLVTPDGSVESVKLVAGAEPATIGEAMLLSAVKSWRFTPATKDGTPVRYRKVLWIARE